MQPETFCIALKNNPVSKNLLSECLQSAEQFGWTVTLFDAVEGNSITEETWNALGIIPSLDNKFQKRKGAQGCSLSHYHLWKYCIDKNSPIVILEHDALILRPWEDISGDYDVTKLHVQVTKIKEDQYTGGWTESTHAYYITPAGADRLVKWVKENFLYHADCMLGSNIVDVGYLENTMVRLNPNNISTIHDKKNNNLRI